MAEHSGPVRPSVAGADTPAAADKPLVSVYMPVYQRGELTCRAIRSVCEQSYSQLEIIVVDDGSDARTRAQVARQCAQDPRIIYLENGCRRNACVTRNRAIFSARGRFITGIDADDLMLPGRIERFVEQFDPRYAFLFTPVLRYAQSGQSQSQSRTLVPGRVSLQQQLSFNRCSNQVFTLTERLRAIGGFDADFVACQDYDTWTRLLLAFGEGYCLPQATYVLDERHAFERITTPARRLAGLEQYCAKHSARMNKRNLKAQALFRLRASTPRPGLVELLRVTTTETLGIAARYYLGQWR